MYKRQILRLPYEWKRRKNTKTKPETAISCLMKTLVVHARRFFVATVVVAM